MPKGWTWERKCRRLVQNQTREEREMNEIKSLKQSIENDGINYMAYYQAKATILLAEQVKRIADLMEAEALRNDDMDD